MCLGNMTEIPEHVATTYLLLQLQPLPIKSLLGLLPSLPKKSSFEFVRRPISQCIYQTLKSLHLSITDLDSSG